jgi:diguanylate cyclase (GGDEF)-like protein
LISCGKGISLNSNGYSDPAFAWSVALINQEDPFRVLIVDDVEDNRELLSRRLERKGCVTEGAESGFVALGLLAKQEFDLVLLDIMMPDLNGIEVLQRIRASHSADALPVIMVTAKVGVSDIVEALELGANDYITKPIEFSVAFARIQTQLARKQTRQALDASLRELAAANQRLKIEIEQRERSDNLVNHLRSHDTLTSLNNRSQICAELSRELNLLPRRDGSLAVLLFDLDGFKSINSAYGTEFGDRLLLCVAQRLRECIRDVDHLGRIGGDEFCVVASVGGSQDAIQLSDRVMLAIAEPYSIDSRRVTLTSCAGIAIAPRDGTESDQLMDNAELALGRARSEGRGHRCFFEVGMDARAKARRLLELDLRMAISAGEFEIFYQPLIDLASGTVSGAEALLRWRHPHRGLISPADFIPLAEETGLIVQLGAWGLQQACREAACWPNELRVAVNISAVQFRNGDLFETVLGALSDAKLSPRLLELEITESVLLNDESHVAELLHNLRQMGVRISLDDFGTGYSSLSYLRAFPFDKIKIDRSFVQEIGTGRNAEVILKALIDLSAGLGATINAEGIETQSQLDWLKLAGCTEAQGYLISRPLPADCFRSFAIVHDGENGSVALTA